MHARTSEIRGECTSGLVRVRKFALTREHHVRAHEHQSQVVEHRRRESPRASVGAASSSADAGEEEWLDAEEGEGELGAGVGDLSDSELAELLDV